MILYLAYIAVLVVNEEPGLADEVVVIFVDGLR